MHKKPPQLRPDTRDYIDLAINKTQQLIACLTDDVPPSIRLHFETLQQLLIEAQTAATNPPVYTN